MFRKVIVLWLCIVVFLFSGCEVYKYPKAEYTEDGNLVYDSQIYIKRDINKDGYHLTGESYSILRTPGLHNYVTMEMNVTDGGRNIIFCRYYNPTYYLKEGFSLPNKAFQCDISSAYIWSRENKKTIHICQLIYPISNIAEGEGLRLELENSMKISCKVEFTKYNYLYGAFDIEEYNGKLYFLIFQDFDYLWFSIKDEYQEIFRNAINELNAMQE